MSTLSAAGFIVPSNSVQLLKLRVEHQTRYHYQVTTQRCMQSLLKTPQTTSSQRVLDWHLSSSIGALTQQKDGFGNVLTALEVNEPHQELTVTASGEVEVDVNAEAIVDLRLPPEMFLHQTPLTTADAAMRDFTLTHLPNKNRNGLIHFAERLLERMPYVPGATQSYTRADQAFLGGQGVCQDHSHVFLACVRDQGLMARYVSGYLYLEQVGHFASHAWAEVMLDGKWWCFDVSNQIFTPRQHIQLAVGRDYLDAAPVRGVREGGGVETMQVSVKIALA